MGTVTPIKMSVEEIVAEAKASLDDPALVRSQITAWLEAKALVAAPDLHASPAEIKAKMAFVVDMMVTKIITNEIEVRTVSEAAKVMEVCARLAREFEYDEIGEMLGKVADPLERRRIMDELRAKAQAANTKTLPA